ncbi:7305_t:CDS:2 [Ambispora leptoticha]|uniref:Peroxisomal membrane protein PEX14 n=1 Tax=Ambispora leptoticha TaxID=144679 RepID=A0A9N9AT55_9GLOM|nr:7305_t:CDS:2 [Ambispora leptoticha]
MTHDKFPKDEENSSLVDLFEGEQGVEEDSDAENWFPPTKKQVQETKEPPLRETSAEKEETLKSKSQQKESKVQGEEEQEENKNDAVRQLLAQEKSQQNRLKTTPTTAGEKIPSISKAPEESPKIVTTKGSETAREKIVESAASFLSSPNVKKASMSKKIAFLKKKGLTEKEIELALERSQRDDITSEDDPFSSLPIVSETNNLTTPPRLPPRTYKMQDTLPLTSAATPVVYNSLSNNLVQTPPPASQSKVATLKKLIVVLFVTGGISGALIHAIKNYILPAARAIMVAQRQLYQHQLELIRKLNENLGTFNFVNRVSSANGQALTTSSDGSYSLDTTSPKPAEILVPIHTTILAIAHLLETTNKRNAESKTIPDALAALNDLSSFLSTKLYDYSSWSSVHERDSPVSQCKSQIRSIKGLLISRRTFPKVPTLPSTINNLGKQQTRVTPNNE